MAAILWVPVSSATGVRKMLNPYQSVGDAGPDIFVMSFPFSRQAHLLNGCAFLSAQGTALYLDTLQEKEFGVITLSLIEHACICFFNVEDNPVYE